MVTLTLDTSGRVDGRAFDDLTPFARGYVEALFASTPYRVCSYCGLDHEIYGGCFSGLKPSEMGLKPERRFSDLAPETLATILQDCDAKRDPTAPTAELERRDGALFWNMRQGGTYAATFPRLTPYLGDDGRVYLREVS